MTELKECPCCGKHAGIEREAGRGIWKYRVFCSGCDLRTDLYVAKWIAIRAWNRRDPEERRIDLADWQALIEADKEAIAALAGFKGCDHSPYSVCPICVK